MPVESPKFDASIRDLRQIRGVTGDLETKPYNQPPLRPAMRPLRVRLTLKSSMIAVGVVGVILFGSITAMRMGSKAELYRSRASLWRIIETGHRKHLVLCQREVDGLVRSASNLRTSHSRFPLFQAMGLARQIARDAAWWRANLEHTKEMIAYSSMMRRGYEHASHYPWLVIAPAPPQPYWSGATGALLDDLPVILEEQQAEQAAGIIETLMTTVVDKPAPSAVSQRIP
jgi:hypothetical protein